MRPPPPAEDRTLVASALAGDEAALGHLLATHQQAAYNVAYRLLGSEPDARDAVQDAFLQTVRAVRSDVTRPRGERFEPWLRRVVANVALGQLRRRPSFRPVPVDEVNNPLSAPEHDDPAHAAERREARGDVLRALLILPDAQRAALTLREYEGLSYDEIAALLGVSRAAVQMLLFRARRGFRTAYEGLAAGTRPVGCPQFAALLTAAADAEVGTGASEDLTTHLDACPDCRRERDELRRAQRLAALVPLLALPTDWHPVPLAIGEAAKGAVDGVQAAAAVKGAGPMASGTATGPGMAAGGGLTAKLATPLVAKLGAVAVAAAIGVAAVTATLLPTATQPGAEPTATVPAAVPSPVTPPVPAASPSATAPPSPTPVR